MAKGFLGVMGGGRDAGEGGNGGRWVRIRPWGLFPSFLASTSVPRAGMEELGRFVGRRRPR